MFLLEWECICTNSSHSMKCFSQLEFVTIKDAIDVLTIKMDAIMFIVPVLMAHPVHIKF